MCRYVLDFANLSKQINNKCSHHFGCVFNRVVNSIYSMLTLNAVSRIMYKFVCWTLIVASFIFRIQIFRTLTVFASPNNTPQNLYHVHFSLSSSFPLSGNNSHTIFFSHFSFLSIYALDKFNLPQITGLASNELLFEWTSKINRENGAIKINSFIFQSHKNTGT